MWVFPAVICIDFCFVCSIWIKTAANKATARQITRLMMICFLFTFTGLFLLFFLILLSALSIAVSVAIAVTITVAISIAIMFLINRRFVQHCA